MPEQSSIAVTLEQLSLEILCVPGFGKVTKKLRKRVSALETAVRAKVNKDGNLPATRFLKTKTDVEAEIRQERLEVEGRIVSVAEF